MQKRSRTGWRRLVDAVVYSVHGFQDAWRHEAAFRQECAMVVLLLPVAFWLGADATQRCLLVFSLMGIPLVELLNSAVEAAIDRIGPEVHELSGRAKNLGSAAVMLSILIMALIWGIIAWDRFQG